LSHYKMYTLVLQWQSECFYHLLFVNLFSPWIQLKYYSVACDVQQQSISMQGLTFEGDSGEEVTLWRLTSLLRWSKAKFKSPFNFEESPVHFFVTWHLWKCWFRVYWNLSYPLSILEVIFLKSNSFRFIETFILHIEFL
jgi:hypothetical protein